MQHSLLCEIWGSQQLCYCQVLWDVKLCSWVWSSLHFKWLLETEEGKIILQKVGNYTPNDRESHTRRCEASVFTTFLISHPHSRISVCKKTSKHVWVSQVSDSFFSADQYILVWIIWWSSNNYPARFFHKINLSESTSAKKDQKKLFHKSHSSFLGRNILLLDT